MTKIVLFSRSVWLPACVTLVFVMAGCQTAETPLQFRSPTPKQPPGVTEAEVREFWDGWAHKNIKTGDIVFRMGSTRQYGIVDSSRLAALVADSNFSHVGMAAIEDGEPVVYDISATGSHRRPFVDFVFEYQLAFGVKRPRPEHQQHIDEAIAFCRAVHEQQPEFDSGMRLDNDTLYCTEMIEVAYRSSGLALSDPMPLQDYPRYKEFSTWMRIADAVTSLDPDQPVYSPGNDNEGMWASDRLETVVEVSDPYAVIRTAQAIQPAAKADRVMQVKHSQADGADAESRIRPAVHHADGSGENGKVIQIPVSGEVLPRTQSVRD